MIRIDCYNSKILSVQKSIQKARDYKKDYEKMTKGDPRFKNMRLKIAALKPEYSNAKLHQVLKSFMIAKDKEVTIKINKGGFNYTPQIDTTLCSSTGTGWNRFNFISNNIYVENENVYVIIEMNENAVGITDDNQIYNS